MTFTVQFVIAVSLVVGSSAAMWGWTAGFFSLGVMMFVDAAVGSFFEEDESQNG